jgi:DNA-directed RNA polymerase subunit RPC12/RpoP
MQAINPKNGLVFNDENIGEANGEDIQCKDCGMILIPKGIGKKVKKSIYFSYDNEREFEPLMDFWKVQKLEDFANIQIYSREGTTEYLSCVRCSTRVLGAIFKTPDKSSDIYISCQRTTL